MNHAQAQLRRKDCPKVYLAGPTVFEENPDAIFQEMKKICAKHGLEGVSPLDNQIGLQGEAPGKSLILKIVQADFELMDSLDGGVFCLDPFRRSTEMDPGTAVEIGYMKAQNKPLAGWTVDGREYPEKVKSFFEEQGEALTETKANDKGGTSGLTRDLDGILVHSDGMVQNGMTQGGIELSGGKVGVDTTWQKAFEAGVISLKEQFVAAERMSPGQGRS